MIEHLYTKDGKQTNKRYCTDCGHSTYEGRVGCYDCGPHVCIECGKPADRGFCKCRDCIAIGNKKREDENFGKANKLESWDSWVCIDDRYFPSVEDLVQELWDNGEDIPKYCWATTSAAFVSLSREAILQAALDEDDAYEDFDEQSIEIPASMFKAIEEFNEANKEHIAYQVDYKNAVMISVEYLDAAQMEAE